MNNYKNIQIDINDRIATLWLNRPEKHNVINGEMLKEITTSLQDLKKESIDMLFLRGRGDSFCAGADLQWFKDPNVQPEDFARQMSQGMQEIFNFSKPVIAVVHGNVFGGGLGLMCASDIILALDNAVFSFPEVRKGLAPATISPFVMQRLKPGIAKYLMYTAKKFDTTEAIQINLIDKKLGEKELEDEIKFLQDSIKLASPLALEETKKLVNKIYTSPVSAEVVELSINTFSKMRSSLDFQEGTKAHDEKRTPNWKK